MRCLFDFVVLIFRGCCSLVVSVTVPIEKIMNLSGWCAVVVSVTVLIEKAMTIRTMIITTTTMTITTTIADQLTHQIVRRHTVL